jgi:hypothetical protein
MYYEIFQALAVEGDVLFSKPFMDLGPDGIVRWKSPASEVFFQFAKHVDVGEGGGVGQVGAVRYFKCMNKSGDCVEKQRTMSKLIPVRFLSPVA